jgi:hypothetical protein
MGGAWVDLIDVGRGTCCARQKRIALLIGNQNYTTEIGRLSNPHNDIALLEGVLKRLDFDVTTVRDAGLASLHQAVNTHVRRVRQSGPDAVSFFYYSGHGAADGTTNYLIPTDVKTIKLAYQLDVKWNTAGLMKQKLVEVMKRVTADRTIRNYVASRPLSNSCPWACYVTLSVCTSAGPYRPAWASNLSHKVGLFEQRK